MKPLLAAFLLGLGGLGASAASAQPAPLDADWPCVQRLVPALSPGMLWSDPSLEAADDREAERLGESLAQRRVSLGEAERRIAAYADGLEPQMRRPKLTAVFLSALDAINRERAEIVAGIKRFARRQRQLGEEIAAVGAALRKGGVGDEAESDLNERRKWGLRLFDEREATLTYLCEQPVLLEQRAFALARALTERLP